MLLRTGWSPVLITALAVAGYIYKWPIEATVPGLVIILVIGLTMMVVGAREREWERALSRLKGLSGYFTRRFAGNSSLAIFAIISRLFNVDNPKLWDWAQACDMSQRIFNTWCDSFISRLENDVRTRRLPLYLRTYLNELWLINGHYYEFVEQFYEVAEKVELPQETIDQYNKFVVEYNAFVQDFQESISALRKVARTEIEPPSVKLAKELTGIKPLKTTQKQEVKPPQATEHKGYIM